MTMSIREFIGKFPEFRLTGSRGYQRSIELLSFGATTTNANWASNHPRRDWDFVTDDRVTFYRAVAECGATQLPCVMEGRKDSLTLDIHEFTTTDNDPQLAQLILVTDDRVKFMAEHVLFPYLYSPSLNETFSSVMPLKVVTPVTKDRDSLVVMWNGAYEIARELYKARS